MDKFEVGLDIFESRGSDQLEGARPLNIDIAEIQVAAICAMNSFLRKQR